MSSTNFTIGFGASSKPSSKVLRPPGGGSSDIFGNDMPATPRSAKNHMASNIFGSDQNSSVKVNGDARRGQKNGGDSYSRLFGEPERPFTPAKNHMKSSIPIGGVSSTKNGNGTISSSSSSTDGGSHHQNGNGKMDNETRSSTTSEYQNGVSKTENKEDNEYVSQAPVQEPPRFKDNSNENNNNNNENYTNNVGTDYNSTTSQLTQQNYDTRGINEYTNSIISPRTQNSSNVPDEHDDNNSLKNIPEVHNNQMNDIGQNNESKTSTADQTDAGNNNNNNNNYNHGRSQQVNQNVNMNGDQYTTTSSGSNRHKKHNAFSSPRRDENGRPIDSNGEQIPISHRLTNMNNPNRSPRSFNPRNPVTGLGVERTNYKPRKWADHKDGNPVTGEGYKPAGAEINTTIPCLNGANQVINKNRIPPGGFSSGLW